jgi:hypothetical protein
MRRNRRQRVAKTCGLSDVTDQKLRGHRPLKRGITNATNTIFSEDSGRRARSLELRPRERRMQAARCLRKDSRACMRVHRDTAWAPDNSVP